MSDRYLSEAARQRCQGPSEPGHLEEENASTHPHRASELAARLVQQPSHNLYVDQILALRQESRVLDANTSINMPSLDVADLGPTARVVLSPSPILAGFLSKDPALAPFRCEDISGDIYIIPQSSKEAWFNLISKHLSFRLYYETASDDIVFHSLTTSQLRLNSIHDDNTTDHSETLLVDYQMITRLGHGHARISSSGTLSGNGDDSAHLCDILVLPRRYLVQETTSVQETGTKRKRDSSDAGQKKRHLNDDRGLVLVNMTPVRKKGSNNARLKVPQDGNPIHRVEPGRTLTIRASRILVRHSGSSVLQNTSANADHVYDSYSLANMRDIVVTKAASVFYARHSIHGLIAVKCLRQIPPVESTAMSTFAQNWENEKRLMQSLDHPSIIKFLGADARFFSIYMEYLPCPDLAGQRSIDHMFTGTADDAIRVLGDMASALDYLAKQRVVHNDIKPANILYDRDRGAVLIDFGVATSVGDVHNGGTPWYLAWEYRSYGHRGPTSDIFALGVTLLYLLQKTPLPETVGRGWKISNVRTVGEDGREMDKWLEKVHQMSRQLGHSEIESLVKRMVLKLPELRPSPRHLIDMYKELFS
ncbi:hypothetical protein E4U55_003216 [Claviceps digitariae]|nr:hypothetical protein E4U55_003216 [Claviceps digitariae]